MYLLEEDFPFPVQPCDCPSHKPNYHNMGHPDAGYTDETQWGAHCVEMCFCCNDYRWKHMDGEPIELEDLM